MRPYSPDTSKGRVVARDDIHHRTADQPKALANRAAKAARHGARQDGQRLACVELDCTRQDEPMIAHDPNP